MKVKKIWMSRESKEKSHFRGSMMGRILGIAVLMLLFICGGMAMIFCLNLPREIASLILCLGTTAAGVYLALRAGRRSVRDVMVFFLTEDDRLFVMDARSLGSRGGTAIGYFEDMGEIRKFLRRLAEKPYLPAGAGEILKVERIRENGSYCTVICQMRLPGRQVTRHTFFLVHGYEEEDLLVWQLQRRKDWESSMGTENRRNQTGVAVSTLLGICCSGICVLSHPEVQQLPTDLYAPFLAGAFFAFFMAVYFGIRYRRGES